MEKDEPLFSRKARSSAKLISLAKIKRKKGFFVFITSL